MRHHCEVIQAIKLHEEKLGQSKEHQKFIVSVNDGEYEEIVTYNEILDHILQENSDDAIYWRFERIVAHQGPLKPRDPDYKGSRYNVLIEWPTGETTFEPLSIIGKDAPVVCAIYAKEKGLLDTEGWKRFKPLAKRQKKLFHMANQVKLRSFWTAKFTSMVMKYLITMLMLFV